MDLKSKIELAISKGYQYDKTTGLVYSKKGKVLNTKDKDGYPSIGLRTKTGCNLLSTHKFGWYSTYMVIPEMIDHINRDRTDNRIENLRITNHLENNWNTKDYKGVYFSKLKQKWRARIRFKGKDIELGFYKTESEAAEAYKNKKEELKNLIFKT